MRKKDEISREHLLSLELRVQGVEFANKTHETDLSTIKAAIGNLSTDVKAVTTELDKIKSGIKHMVYIGLAFLPDQIHSFVKLFY